MIQFTLENAVLLHATQALLAGSAFVFCVWMSLWHPSKRSHLPAGIALFFLCSAAVLRGLYASSRLGAAGFPDISWLLSFPSAVDTAALGCLAVWVVPCPRRRKVLAVATALLVLGHLTVRQTPLQGAAPTFELSDPASFLHVVLAFLVLFSAWFASSKGWNLLLVSLSLFGISHLAEAIFGLYWPGASVFWWNLGHLSMIGGLLCLALHLQREGPALPSQLALRLSLVVTLVASIVMLLMSESLRRGYLRDSAAQAQDHLGEFLQGEVVQLSREGLSPPEIVGHSDVSHRIASQFTWVPGAREIKMEVRGLQLLAAIDEEGVISYRTGTGLFSSQGPPSYDHARNTVTILRTPLLLGDKPIGILQFDADLLSASRAITEQLLRISSLTVMVLAAVAGGFLYTTYRQRRRDTAAAAQLQQAQKMEAVGRLAGGVAHDFNNLLTAILGYSELLLEQLGETHPLRSDVEEVMKAASRAAALTRHLLAFSRKQVLQPRMLDLNSAVRDVEVLLRRVIGEDIILVTAPAPDLAVIKADPTQIEQVLMNLAVNARDAMAHGGTLSVGTANATLDEAFARRHLGARLGRYAALIVSDTGCGMGPEVLAHIFEPFFTTKGEGQGTGLGLSTVYGIVKQSGGYIDVQSEPGQGTTFTIYLPRVDGLAEPLVSATTVAEARRGSEIVLLVEDEQGVRELARRVLERQGYTVLEARDANEALDISTRHLEPIHLLVTDVVMPGLSGCELARRLMASRRETKILYMSGYSREFAVDLGELSSRTAFLPKPFTPEALALKVRDVLDALAPARSPGEGKAGGHSSFSSRPRPIATERP